MNYEMILGYKGLPFRALIHGVNKRETHWHNHIEILLVLDGSIEVRIKDRKYILKKDDVFIINSKEIHHLMRTEDKNIVLLLQIDIKHYSSYYPKFRKTIFENNYFNEDENKEVRKILKRHIAKIVWQLNKENPGYKFAMGSEINLILELMIAKVDKIESREITNRNEDKQFFKIKKILDYVEENFQKGITLDEIAQEFYFSSSHLSRFFRDMMGITFQEYIDYVRLDKASELLLSTDKLVIDVATESGLSSVKTLNRLFRKYYKSTPSEFRDKYIDITQKIQQRIEENDKRSKSYFDVDRTNAYECLFKYLYKETENDKKDIDEINITSNPIDIATSIDKNTEPFSRYWKELTTFGRAAEGLRSDVQMQLKELQKDICFKYARFHGVFSDDMMIYNLVSNCETIPEK